MAAADAKGQSEDACSLLPQDPRLDVVLCFVDASSSPTDASAAASQDAPPAPAAAADAKPGSDEEGGGPSAPQGQDKAAAWDTGEMGGFEAYLLAEEDTEGNAAAADTYRAVSGGRE